MSKSEYMKEYRQTKEAKEANKERMAQVYQTEAGQKYEHKKRRTTRSRYMRGKRNAQKRGKEFTLTYEEYDAMMLNAYCTYCNTSLYDETGIGLDRIDNTKGYIPGNVNPCCKKCNRIRANSMGASEFKKQTRLNKRWKSE